ncbi:sensor histidine kinase [Anaeromyxobacter oryzae]|uniref:histidine kinase n=1 Tax=Anaeromyxobacter oryzae TaxID=2918170 RepID=A0ABM7WPF7_9BACT|nr:sensor histidine kinase [Anaeromyxobacter oryzae]BDG01351.1 sodium:solute symporter [Anaeromyxobacter oryzae]
MLRAWVIVLVSFAYLGVLFAIAWLGDRRAAQGRSIIANPYTYALSLAVYCTTWTFYGSVGRAASSGVGFLPVYLGPTLVIALWWYVWRKVIRISKTYRITSIADFVASRYGKSQSLGGIVTVIAVLGVIPYISLQLKAISGSFTILLHYPQIVMPAKVEQPFWQDSALYIAATLAAFAILFGARHLDATERHEGLVAAIAFESVVKLVAFVAVGAFVTFGLYRGFGDVFRLAQETPRLRGLMTVGSGGYATWGFLTVLSMLSIMFLPRQFQISVVENVDEDHLAKAIWLFPLYLLLINVFVLPVALGGLLHLGGQGVDADTFVLTLPMSQRREALALLAFIGGLSAGTGMVVVETIALSTMVCNDLVMPVLLRWRWLRLHERTDLSGLLLTVRRWAIAVILILGYVYFRAAGEAYALVAIGLISFAAVAQFAPPILGGIYWKGATRAGAIAGLSAGFAVWAYTLALPSFAKSGWLPAGFLDDGLLGVRLLRPQQLFGLTGLDDISHALFWSLLANVSLYVGVSVAGRPGAAETDQAALFVDVFRHTQGLERSRLWRRSASVADLLPLLGRFLGPDRARDAFLAHARRRGVRAPEDLPADADLVHFAETQLAGAIGAASARVMVASVVQEEPPGLDEVMDILDEASQVRAYSRELEEKSRQLEAATAELRAANAQLQQLDRLKDDFMSTVTHELRTPLTSIRAFSEILRDTPDAPPAERARFLSIIVKEAERLTRLINQMLDLAKIESGNAEWHASELDLHEVLREAVDATSQLFRAKDVSLSVSIPEPLPRVRADPDRLMQVLINLLSNAVNFSPPRDGRVEVRVTANDEAVRVDVLDNGPGISPADHATVFEKFRQVGDRAGERPRGTGLGLPISRRIVEHFGGRLWVDSELGRGATFSFVLPLHPGAHAADAGAARTAG